MTPLLTQYIGVEWYIGGAVVLHIVLIGIFIRELWRAFRSPRW